MPACFLRVDEVKFQVIHPKTSKREPLAQRLKKRTWSQVSIKHLCKISKEVNQILFDVFFERLRKATKIQTLVSLNRFVFENLLFLDRMGSFPMFSHNEQK